jgi:hypothetical protein
VSRYLNSTMVDTFMDCGSMFATYPLCALWRHGMTSADASRGVYYVVVCIDGVDSFDAVMDDFGNLVRVS